MLPDWAKEQHISHRSFKLIDLVDLAAASMDTIVGRTFEDCTIYGPSIMLPMGESNFEHNAFESPPKADGSPDLEGLFWTVPQGPEFIVGCIGVLDCTFRRCNFRLIGIAGSAKSITTFRKAMLGQGG